MNNQLGFVQVEVTTRCNFRCGFCAGRHLPQRDMALDVFQRFLQSASDLGYIHLQGEGEPLVHPGFFDMVQAAKAARPAVRISMTTNGSLLARHAERIVEAGLDRVCLSIESTDPAVFHEIRGARLEQVLDGANALLAARKARRSERPTVGFAVTVLRKTVKELPAIAALYETLGMDGGIEVQPLQQMPTYTRIYAPEMAAQLLSHADHLELERTVAEDRTTIAVLRAPMKGTSIGREFFARWTPAWGTCPWFEKGL